MAILACLVGIAAAQTEPQPETTTKDQPASFKSKVNLVMVPVVVRDGHGRAAGTLKQDDFRLYDQGKPQLISRFSIERQGSSADGERKPESMGAQPGVTPERYVAYVFDDIHLRMEDLIRARQAAWKHLGQSSHATDRAAIYTTSGQVSLEFSRDEDLFQKTLMQIVPRPNGIRSHQGCPVADVSYYIADRIVNLNDQTALYAIAGAIAQCDGDPPPDAEHRAPVSSALSQARILSYRALEAGGQENRLAIGVLRDIVRHMSTLPGQRSIVLVSQGFFTPPEMEQDKADVMDRAIRSGITINTLDARGVWIDSAYDASAPSYGTALAIYEHQENTAVSGVLADFAEGTGGTFFHGNNDLGEGFRKTTEAPEFVYLLGFSPQNLKLDGSFHALKVTLKNPAGLTVTARKGYTAPRSLSDPTETAREEIREAVFSRDEVQEIPITLRTQFFKPARDAARLSVFTHVNVTQLHFRQDQGRNRDDVTVVSALFDANGNYLASMQKLVELRLKDETVSAGTAMTVRTIFDVKPGDYLIRVVVRDGEGQEMSARNIAVEIP